MFVDTHCHLTDPQFDADRDAVIARAVEAGVTRMVTLATDVVSSRAVVELADKHPQVYAAVGIHPEAVRQASLDDLKIVRELAAHPKVVAIGEIGLDYYWDKTTVELQQKFFEQQLELAAELNLPVAIHDREAHEKIVSSLIENRERNDVSRRGHGVLHAFSGDRAMARTAIELGYLVSFGGPITFLNNRGVPELLSDISLGKLLLETDSPYLAPHPMRGKRNEPANVKLVAARVAALKQTSIEQVAVQTTENAMRLFKRINNVERL